MAKLVKDLSVIVGTYINKEGEQKNRYQTIGNIMESDDGNHFILLNRTFNIAGVPNPENRDAVVVGIYDPKGKDGTGSTLSANATSKVANATAQVAHNQAKSNGYAPKDVADIEDDMPF